MDRRISEEWAALNEVYPGFGPMEQRGDRWTTIGRLPIIDADGVCWEVYDLEISIPANFPASLPAMWETGKKIERTAGWHVNGDGSCCVGTDARQYHLLKECVSLLSWVERLAIPYLANHKLRLLKKAYASGERSHGTKGILEEYEELFADRNDIPLLHYLKLVTGRVSFGRNAICFCESGKKYKYCFLRNQQEHRKFIPSEIILRDLCCLEKGETTK
jgi:hypothetical protein